MEDRKDRIKESVLNVVEDIFDIDGLVNAEIKIDADAEGLVVVCATIKAYAVPRSINQVIIDDLPSWKK